MIAEHVDSGDDGRPIRAMALIERATHTAASPFLHARYLSRQVAQSSDPLIAAALLDPETQRNTTNGRQWDRPENLHGPMRSGLREELLRTLLDRAGVERFADISLRGNFMLAVEALPVERQVNVLLDVVNRLANASDPQLEDLQRIMLRETAHLGGLVVQSIIERFAAIRLHHELRSQVGVLDPRIFALAADPDRQQFMKDVRALPPELQVPVLVDLADRLGQLDTLALVDAFDILRASLLHLGVDRHTILGKFAPRLAELLPQLTDARAQAGLLHQLDAALGGPLNQDALGPTYVSLSEPRVHRRIDESNHAVLDALLGRLLPQQGDLTPHERGEVASNLAQGLTVQAPEGHNQQWLDHLEVLVQEELAASADPAVVDLIDSVIHRRLNPGRSHCGRPSAAELQALDLAERLAGRGLVDEELEVALETMNDALDQSLHPEIWVGLNAIWNRLHYRSPLVSGEPMLTPTFAAVP